MFVVLVYLCMFTSPGAYVLTIHWSDRPIKGSPFKVNVVAQGDASKVIVNMEGIRSGAVDKETKVTIDTRNAGPGQCQA